MKFQIKEAREYAGFSQKELAEKIGVAPNTFHGYESGKHDPKSEILIDIAQACNVSVDFLLGLSKEKPPAPAEADAGDQRLDGIIENYHQLNEAGQQQLAEQAEGLTYIPKYKKCDSVSEKETEVG